MRFGSFGFRRGFGFGRKVPGVFVPPSVGITLVGSKTADIPATAASNTTISLTDLSGGIGSQPIEGDYVYIAYATASSGNPAIGIVTADYSELSELNADDTQDSNLSVSRKKMTSTPDTSVDVGPTGSTNDDGCVAIFVLRGVHATTPEDVAVVTATGTNTGRPNAGAVTPTTSGAKVLVCCSAGSPQDVGAVFAQSGSELSNFITRNTSAAVRDATVGMGMFDWTSGAFDPAAWVGSNTNTSSSWCAVTIALRPA